MYVVTVAQSKGGVGKTTLAVNIAAELARIGKRVTLFDTDPQGSAMEWATQQKLVFPVLPNILSLRSHIIWTRNILKANSGYSVLDLPSGLGITFDTAVLISDIIVLPCGPSNLDISAIRKTIERAREAARVDPKLKINLLIVPTRIDLTTDEGRQLSEELADLGEAVGPGISYDMSFSRSFGFGEPVLTSFPEERADLEIRALTGFMLRRLGVRLSP